MKKPCKIIPHTKERKRVFVFFASGIMLFYLSVSAMAAPAPLRHNNILPASADTTVAVALQAQINAHQRGLYYPLSVERFYRKSGYKLNWIAPDTTKTHSWEAMLMLDCVLQFGLNHSDYHPRELLYDNLHLIADHFDKINSNEKAGFDIMLTDAVIAFMNNLHYGKLNPDYPAGKIDSGYIAGFSAETILTYALQQKDFMSAVLSVQPKSAAYKKLQYQMHLLTGLYTGDCYEVPEASIRKIAVNLERLRWINDGNGVYININIPSYTLKLCRPDRVYKFKVTLGKPGTLTPALQSAIKYFTTAAGLIVFRCTNTSDIYLHGIPEQSLLRLDAGTFSHGYVRVAHAEKLAALLLKGDGAENKIASLHKAMMAYKHKVFILKKAVPVKITYLTCEVLDGILTTYSDIYNLDRRIEQALYNSGKSLTMR